MILRRRQISLRGLRIVPAWMVILVMVWGSIPSGAAGMLAPSTQTSAAGSRLTPDISDPGLSLYVLDASRKVTYEVGGRNIFRMDAETSLKSQPPSSPSPSPSPIQNAAPAPMQPRPIPIKYYGYANKAGEARKVFLQQWDGAQIFIAAQGEIVARRYRIVQITPQSIMMEDVFTSNRQPIALTVR